MVLIQARLGVQRKGRPMKSMRRSLPPVYVPSVARAILTDFKGRRQPKSTSADESLKGF